MKRMVVKVEDVELNVSESEKSIQINDIFEDKFELIWERLMADYSGYEIFFSFNSERMLMNQKIPTQFLDKINAELVDDTLIYRLKVTDFTSKIEKKLEIDLLDQAGFDEFAHLHDHRNPDFFWTSKRLKAHLDIWQIHILKRNKQLTGYAMTMLTKQIAEIFAIESDDELAFKALLSTTCQTAFTAGKAEVLYMIEKTTPTNYHQIAKDLGFKEIGYYQGFRTYL